MADCSDAVSHVFKAACGDTDFAVCSLDKSFPDTPVWVHSQDLSALLFREIRRSDCDLFDASPWGMGCSLFGRRGKHVSRRH